MRSFRLDPYLWVHLAGLAAVPLWLDICLLGLAAGNPVLPVWIELGFLSLVGALPILWMQWQKPFCIFSLLFLALRPDRMSEDRRRILRLFRDPLLRFVAGLAPLPLIWALWKLYTLAPLVAEFTPFPNHWVGLLVTAIAFLLANLFVQVPLSVMRVLLTPEPVFAKIPPYPPEQIKKDFTLLGLRVNRILPEWQTEAAAKSSDAGVTAASETAGPLSVPPAWDDPEIPLRDESLDETVGVISPAPESVEALHLGDEAVAAALAPGPAVVDTEQLPSAASTGIEMPQAEADDGQVAPFHLNMSAPETSAPEMSTFQADLDSPEIETPDSSEPSFHP